MNIVVAFLGLFLIVLILRDAFETIVLPRRVTRMIRLTSFFYIFSWFPWRAFSQKLKNIKARDTFLGFYGPLSLLLLLAIWAISLVIGFGLMEWGFQIPLSTPSIQNSSDVGTYLYMSGVTFFTLGFGDVTPGNTLGRYITVGEAGVGFGFLGLVIGYLPVIYSSFAQREIAVSMLDARAGSPPSALELIRRHATYNNLPAMEILLKDWELWSAQLLESHLSYPVLCYYRSQHENQSWVSSLTTILDVCALVLTGLEGVPRWTAWLTFAMARHTAVDLTQIFRRKPISHTHDRLPPPDMVRLRQILVEAGVPLIEGPEAEAHLLKLREMYEPYLTALSHFLLMELPAWLPADNLSENWRSTAWQQPDQTNIY